MRSNTSTPRHDLIGVSLVPGAELACQADRRRPPCFFESRRSGAEAEERGEVTPRAKAGSRMPIGQGILRTPATVEHRFLLTSVFRNTVRIHPTLACFRG
jgi:hypothetical protein